MVNVRRLVMVGLILSLSIFCGAVSAQIVVNPGQGHDIGPALNSAIAQFAATPTTPGTILITTGSYALSETVSQPHWVTIDGQNSVINVSSLSVPAIVCGEAKTDLPDISPLQVTSYAQGGVRNLTLFGGGTLTPYGIWLGPDPSGTNAPSNITDYLEVFQNVHVQNFGKGYVVGGTPSTAIGQASWVGGSITLNGDGVYLPSADPGSENLNMHGTQILNNGQGSFTSGYGINNAASNIELNLYGVSLDYNTSGGINWNGGSLNLFGCHLEQLSGYLINGTSSNFQTILNLIASTLALTATLGTDTALIKVGGTSARCSFTLDFMSQSVTLSPISSTGSRQEASTH